MRLKMHPGMPHDTKELATHVGMAHFAQTGPSNTYCSQCEHRWKGGCAKFVQLTKSKVKLFPGETPSCRHFAPKGLDV
jgi:hypothetical protein